MHIYESTATHCHVLTCISGFKRLWRISIVSYSLKDQVPGRQTVSHHLRGHWVNWAGCWSQRYLHNHIYALVFSICFWSLVTSGYLCINAHEIDRRFQEMKFDPFNVEAKREPSGCTSYTLYRAPVVQNLNRFIHRYLSTDMVWVVIYPVDTC